MPTVLSLQLWHHLNVLCSLAIKRWSMCSLEHWQYSRTAEKEQKNMRDELSMKEEDEQNQEKIPKTMNEWGRRLIRKSFSWKINPPSTASSWWSRVRSIFPSSIDILSCTASLSTKNHEKISWRWCFFVNEVSLQNETTGYKEEANKRPVLIHSISSLSLHFFSLLLYIPNHKRQSNTTIIGRRSRRRPRKRDDGRGRITRQILRIRKNILEREWFTSVTQEYDHHHDFVFISCHLCSILAPLYYGNKRREKKSQHKEKDQDHLQQEIEWRTVLEAEIPTQDQLSSHDWWCLLLFFLSVPWETLNESNG